MRIGLLAVFLIPVSATAQNPFDGTWKINLNNAKLPEKPDVYVVQNGMYDCQSCVPPFKIKADGQDQKVSGHPYFDTMIITIVDDHSIEQSTKKDGKVNSTSKWTVSADGNTMTQTFSDSSASNGDPVTGKADATRVAKGPAGSHTVSGSWRTGKVDSVSDNGLLFSYKVDGDTLSMTTPTGQSYTAKLDGTDAPFQGDPGISSVSLRRTSKNSIEETDKRDGKVISISVMTISPDGKSMTIANTDKLHSTTSQFVADKQ
jgi:hypothetical protein